MPILTGQQIGAVYNNIGPDLAVLTGTSITLTNDYSNKTVLLNSATGSTVTLPPATGSGVIYKFLQTAAAPSSPHVIKVSASTAGNVGAGQDYFVGNIETVDAAVVTGYIAANSATVATNSDTITLSATTTGGLSAGSWVEIQDILNNTWSVKGITSSSGTAATPFSASVS